MVFNSFRLVIIIIDNSLILAYNTVIYTNKLALESDAIFKIDKYRFKSINKNIYYLIYMVTWLFIKITVL